MKKHVWLFFMRAAQLVGLSIAVSGLRQLGPLVTGMGQAVNGELDAAELSQRLIAVTGRLLAGLLFVWVLELFIHRERQQREGLFKHPCRRSEADRLGHLQHGFHGRHDRLEFGGQDRQDACQRSAGSHGDSGQFCRTI